MVGHLRQGDDTVIDEAHAALGPMSGPEAPDARLGIRPRVLSGRFRWSGPASIR